MLIGKDSSALPGQLMACGPVGGALPGGPVWPEHRVPSQEAEGQGGPGVQSDCEAVLCQLPWGALQ